MRNAPRTRGLAAALLALALAAPAVAWAGPFGFEMGMTLAQLKARGIKARPLDQPHTYRVDRAPRPDPAFEGYLLRIDPARGLIALTAVGKDIRTGPTGAALRKQFRAVETRLSARYGDPHRYDGLEAGSELIQPEEWMEGLVAEERALAAFWGLEPEPDDPPLPDHVARVSLQALADRPELGYLKLTFEFTNHDAAPPEDSDGSVTL